MMKQAAWLTVLLVMVCSLPMAVAEAVVMQPSVGLASDAAPIQRFIQVPATGWDPGANARKRYAGGIFDWVRRVDVDRSALASSRIQIELFDEVLIVERTEPAGREPEVEHIYVPSIDGTRIRQETTILRTLWVGQVVGRAGHPSARLGKVRITALNDGRLATNVTVGMINYELIGNLLVRIDLSRLPGEAPTVRDPLAAGRRVPVASTPR